MAAFRIVTVLSERQCAELQELVAAATAPRNDDGCLLVDVSSSPRLSTNAKGYVQLKVPVDAKHKRTSHQKASSCTNKKVQLHQLVMWMSELEGTFFQRHMIENGGNEVSHLCSKKNCANGDHLWAESSSVNKSRNYCEVVVSVNGTLLDICRHMPQCIATSEKKRNALRLVLNQA
jgi:hypothetical protein